MDWRYGSAGRASAAPRAARRRLAAASALQPVVTSVRPAATDEVPATKCRTSRSGLSERFDGAARVDPPVRRGQASGNTSCQDARCQHGSVRRLHLDESYGWRRVAVLVWADACRCALRRNRRERSMPEMASTEPTMTEREARVIAAAARVLGGTDAAHAYVRTRNFHSGARDRWSCSGNHEGERAVLNEVQAHADGGPI